jgi:hypothetical protein
MNAINERLINSGQGQDSTSVNVKRYATAIGLITCPESQKFIKTLAGASMIIALRVNKLPVA